MKKFIFLLAIVTVLLTASCKKDYNCNCVGTLSGGQTTNVTSIINNTKAKAKTTCTGYQTSSAVGNETLVCTIQ